MSRADVPVHGSAEVSDGAGNILAPGSDGMTLREYFAGQALAGLVVETVGAETYTAEGAARRAVRFADALIVALAAPVQS